MDNKFVLSEGAKKLLKKCKEKDIDPNVIWQCKLLLEELERGNIDLSEDDPDKSYIKISEEIENRDVTKILTMAFEVKDRPNIEPELKIAADRLIRSIESL